MLTLPHRTIWTDAAISLFSTWQAILIRTYLATDCWWTHSFVFACVSQMLWCVGWRHNNCKDCSLSNNDQRQYSSWCLFNLLLDCYYSCSCCCKWCRRHQHGLCASGGLPCMADLNFQQFAPSTCACLLLRRKPDKADVMRLSLVIYILQTSVLNQRQCDDIITDMNRISLV